MAWNMQTHREKACMLQVSMCLLENFQMQTKRERLQTNQMNSLYFTFLQLLCILPPKVRNPHQWEVGGWKRSDRKILDNWHQVFQFIVFQTVASIFLFSDRADWRLISIQILKNKADPPTGWEKRENSCFINEKAYDKWNSSNQRLFFFFFCTILYLVLQYGSVLSFTCN